jgi:lysine 6-dehydrogenase
MGYRYVVLGSGRQGVALAYDLAKNGEAERVRLLDSDAAAARRAAERLARLLPGSLCAFEPIGCDVTRASEVMDALSASHATLSAVPYKFNVELAKLAIAARTSFLDLGGNTSVVRAELALDAEARAAGVSIVPDCGLAPGLGNHLAAYGISEMDQPEHVHVRCGGLPERPVGPLAYKLVFNFYGLWNEYRGCGEFLRDGRRIDVPTLTELETLDFGAPLGRLEAAVTSGGTSTCPETWLGKLASFDYKTLRYPGHWEKIRALFELGFMEPTLAAADGEVHEPLRMTQLLFEKHLAFPDVRDVVVLRTTVRGRHRGAPLELQFDLFDRHDDRAGFTAMERTTAFPAALVAHLQARGAIAPGAKPLEVCVPPKLYFDELARHDVAIRTSRRAG